MGRLCRYLFDFQPSQNATQGTTHESRLMWGWSKNFLPRRHSPIRAPQTPSNQLNPVKQVKPGGTATRDQVSNRYPTTRHECQLVCPKVSDTLCQFSIRDDDFYLGSNVRGTLKVKLPIYLHRIYFTYREHNK